MSEPKLISPMLDNFDMGDPISEHNGVRCCPAMEKDSDHKYIVKIISTPATQVQLDALLISGAFQDTEAAAAYFKGLAEGIISEANTLEKLSQFDGFTPYKSCQLVPMDEGVGYDTYLLSEYRNTLQQHLRCGSLTQLAAINLGLDLCSALSACRRSGYLYVNLKPTNIYLFNEQSYRIGDIGFLSLNSLKYTSLPDRYHSEYTAPEITDAFSALNTTIDIYALGLILYQVYNDGILPTPEDHEELAAPAYADYEMAEIILKACSLNPEDRWQDPAEMGQALVAYMQRNGANNIPIVPVPVMEEQPSNSDEMDSQDALSDESTEMSAISEDSPDSVVLSEEEPIEAPADCDTDSDQEPEITTEDIYTEDDAGNLTLLDDESEDETLPDDTSAEIIDIEITDEVSEILEQADALIAHPTPDPVVQPEAIEVQVPCPADIPAEEPETEAECKSDQEDTEETAVTETATDTTPTAEETGCDEDIPAESDNTDDEDAPHKHTGGAWIRNTVIVLSIIALIIGGLLFYKNYYLQPIESITLQDGGIGSLTVLVDSRIPDEKLTVVCSDTYGNQLFSPVINGKAEFYDLAPNAAYTVRVQISGFHRLTGDTSAAYTTPQQTNIVQFTAVTGAEDGSVVLGFTIDGPDSEQWKIVYTDDAGENQEIVFSGHILTINTLTIGKTYQFELLPIDDSQIAGINTVEHVATTIVKAQNVTITGRDNNKLSASWSIDSNANVNSWTVRCYSDNGFDQTQVTAEMFVEFDIPEEKADYTVEVTAAGMSVSERAFAPGNAISVRNFQIDDSDPSKLLLSWDADVTDGWLLTYSINGSAAHEIVCGEEGNATISPLVPGCEYQIALQTTNGTPVLGGSHIHITPTPVNFTGYGVSAEHMEFKLCRTPSYSGWDRYDLSSDDYTTNFEIGEKASFLIQMHHEYNTSSDVIDILFAFRDEDGVVVWTSTTSSTWTKLWYKNYCELDIPSLPQTPGKYTVSIYFNGALAGENGITITE